ncbi:M20 family metallo-hydrolase [uncultured Muribaculum sp.]|uniref:M20 family metallo-hydrolase n=2 Tax=uncultured Muribaculum sp. TaxID=1918613 RepID=UPI002616D58D|nr:M20 family metallo-hydrolase [uncultured Muribaculum sp.]
MNEMDTDELYYMATDLLKSLIATPSVSRDETAAANIIEETMRKLGFEPRRHINNVWAVAPGYDVSLPTILLNSHIDTVKPVEGWTRDPYLPAEDPQTERLYGLGSNDAGASLVSLIGAFAYMGRRPREYNLVMLASAQEEVSGRDGMEAVVTMLPHIDMAIVGEPTGMRPAIAEKGLMVIDAEARGVAGHAARDEGVNAIYKAMDAICRLRSLKLEKVSDMLGPVKMTVTQIEAGTQHNVVPDTCRFVIDVRTTDVYSNEETLEIMRRELPGCTLTPRSTRLNPSSISRMHPVVRRLEMLGFEPFGSPTLSDQALMPWPSVKCGPGDSARSHTPDEYILLPEIRSAIAVYTRVLDGLKL